MKDRLDMVRPPVRTALGIVTFVVLGGLVIWGLADRLGSDDDSPSEVAAQPADETTTTLPPTTTTTRPPTKAEAVEAVNRVCRRFLELDPTNAARITSAEYAAVARLRIRAINTVLPLVDEVPAPNDADQLRTQAKEHLLAIRALLGPNTGLPDTADVIATGSDPHVRDTTATIELGKLAVSLMEYGAQDCAPR